MRIENDENGGGNLGIKGLVRLRGGIVGRRGGRGRGWKLGEEETGWGRKGKGRAGARREQELW